MEILFDHITRQFEHVSNCFVVVHTLQLFHERLQVAQVLHLPLGLGRGGAPREQYQLLALLRLFGHFADANILQIEETISTLGGPIAHQIRQELLVITVARPNRLDIDDLIEDNAKDNVTIFFAFTYCLVDVQAFRGAVNDVHFPKIYKRRNELANESKFLC